MTSYRYTSTSFQRSMTAEEAEEIAVKLVGNLNNNPVLRGAVVAIDARFNQFDVTASVDADGASQMAVMMVFHAADMEWLAALEEVGARKHVCRSSMQLD